MHVLMIMQKKIFKLIATIYSAMKIPETEIAYWNVIYRLHFRDGPTTTSNK
jgi:hypothetical protein